MYIVAFILQGGPYITANLYLICWYYKQFPSAWRVAVVGCGCAALVLCWGCCCVVVWVWCVRGMLAVGSRYVLVCLRYVRGAFWYVCGIVFSYVFTVFGKSV